MPRPRRLLLRLLVAVAGAVVFVAWSAGSAQAHAVLETTNPPAGAEVARLPAEVTLQFGEGVTIDDQSLQVLSATGARVDARSVVHPDGAASQVATALPATLPHGSYTVVWRVISADSHPVAGTFSFGYGVPAGASVRAPAGSSTVGLLNGIARFVSYAGIVLAGGVLVFTALIWSGAWSRQRVEILFVAGLGLVAVAAAALIVLAGPYDSAQGIGEVFSRHLLRQTLSTKYGKLMALRLLLAVLGLLVFALSRKQRSSRWRPDLLAIGIVMLLTFSLSEHAGTGRQAPLAAAVDVVHLGSVVAWIGGLVVLLLVLSERSRPLPGGTLRRWSRLAFTCVVLIIATGAYASWREIGTLPAFWETVYGRLVLAKIGLLVLLIGLGAYGRKLTRAADAETASAAALRRSVGVETAIAAGVIAVAAILVEVQPGRDSYNPAHTMTVVAQQLDGSHLQTRIHVNTTRPGRTTLTVAVLDSHGRPQSYQQVSGLLTEPAQQLGPIRFTLPASAKGTGSTTVVIPRAGHWEVDLQIQTDSVTDYAASASYLVR